MPRKFHRVLRKGYSVRKPVKNEPAVNRNLDESSEDEALSVADASSSTTVKVTCEVATQTEMSIFSTKEIFTQTDVSVFHLAEISTQTDLMFSMTDAAIDTGN